MYNRAYGEVADVVKRNHRPGAGQYFPAADAENREKERGQQDDAHRAPAVERVQQAHGGLFVLEGARLHDGTAQHLDQAAADGINDGAQEDAGKRVGQELRQKGEARQPGGGAHLRGHGASAVSDTVRKAGA